MSEHTKAILTGLFNIAADEHCNRTGHPNPGRGASVADVERDCDTCQDLLLVADLIGNGPLPPETTEEG